MRDRESMSLWNLLVRGTGSGCGPHLPYLSRRIRLFHIALT